MLVRLTENIAVVLADVKMVQYMPATGSIEVGLLNGSTWSLPGRSKRYFNKLVETIGVRD